MLLEALGLVPNGTVSKENEKKKIGIGITVLKIAIWGGKLSVIWGGKLSVLWLKIAQFTSQNDMFENSYPLN